MAACGSLHSFSSWNQINPMRNESLCTNEMKSVSDTSPEQSTPSSSTQVENQSPAALDFYPSIPKACNLSYTSCHRRSDSFSSFNSESLQLCTEGLGFESTDDIEDATDEMNADWQENNHEEASSGKKLSSGKPFDEHGRSSRSSAAAEFPPPISSIGKPWVSFRSYRHDGRFVLKEIRTPSHEFLQASREDGRLKLRFLHPRDDILDEQVEEEEEEEERESDQDLGFDILSEEKQC